MIKNDDKIINEESELSALQSIDKQGLFLPMSNNYFSNGQQSKYFKQHLSSYETIKQEKKSDQIKEVDY